LTENATQLSKFIIGHRSKRIFQILVQQTEVPIFNSKSQDADHSKVIFATTAAMKEPTKFSVFAPKFWSVRFSCVAVSSRRAWWSGPCRTGTPVAGQIGRSSR